MRSLLAIALAVVSGASVAAADAFDERLKQGFGHLRAGDVDAAVDVFRDLQTEAPDSDLIKYSLAATKYRQALKDLENNLAEEAVTQLQEARADMHNLAASPDPFVSQNAAFIAANCDAQLAKQMAAAGDQKKTLDAFRGAIEGYEEVLRQAPEHAGARQNREHMRYLLKRMLQNPPPEQPQQGEGEDEQQEQQEGDQEQQSQQQQPGDQSEQQDEQKQDQQQQQQGDNQEQQQPEEGEEQQEPAPEEQESEDEGQQEQQPEPEEVREELQEQTGAAGDQQDMQGEPIEETQESLNRQNIEAILQSLEELARDEQKNLRRAKRPPHIRDGKWW